MIFGDVLNYGLCNVLLEGYVLVKVVEWFNEVVYKVIVVCGNCDSEVD